MTLFSWTLPRGWLALPLGVVSASMLALSVHYLSPQVSAAAVGDAGSGADTPHVVVGGAGRLARTPQTLDMLDCWNHSLTLSNYCTGAYAACGWIVVCLAAYSATAQAPPEPNSYRSEAHPEGVAVVSRATHVCIIMALAAGQFFSLTIRCPLHHFESLNIQMTTIDGTALL